jgi:hypothetical protein
MAKRRTRKPDPVEKVIDDYVRIPAIMLIGMAVAGGILDSLLHTTNVFILVFAAFGGIPAIALHYRRKWQKSTDA